MTPRTAFSAQQAEPQQPRRKVAWLPAQRLLGWGVRPDRPGRAHAVLSSLEPFGKRLVTIACGQPGRGRHIRALRAHPRCQHCQRTLRQLERDGELPRGTAPPLTRDRGDGPRPA